MLDRDPQGNFLWNGYGVTPLGGYSFRIGILIPMFRMPLAIFILILKT